MCYYNGVKVTRAEYIRLKDLEKVVLNYDFLNAAIINGFDYGETPVLKRQEGVRDFDIVQMVWGFLPNYVRNSGGANKFRSGYVNSKGKYVKGYTTLNANGDELFSTEKSGMFDDAARHRRCLILSTGFFEWRHIYKKNKRTGEENKTPIKYPYHIGVKEQPYFFMAGVWEPWVDNDTGECVDTVALVTTKANPVMEIIHNSRKRMPTILPEELAYSWLFDTLTDEDIMAIGTYQLPAQEMEFCPISKDFRTAVDPTEPFSYEELPPIELIL
jgi:putative SOS response-associated peptidase YedK